MNTTKKKTQQDTHSDLLTALLQFIDLLEGQKEADAVRDLRQASEELAKHDPAAEEYKAALAVVLESFTGEHELDAYTLPGESHGNWSERDDLYLASSKVLNLVKRLVKSV